MYAGHKFGYLRMVTIAFVSTLISKTPEASLLRSSRKRHKHRPRPLPRKLFIRLHVYHAQLSSRKRQADEVDDEAEPDTKKVRLEADGADDSVMTEEPSVDSTPGESSTISKPKSRPPRKKDLLGETGGTFKENPYTFLSPDDPSVEQCM